MSARMSGRHGRVAVYGASGHTGKFVVAELARRGLAAIAVGRDLDRVDSALDLIASERDVDTAAVERRRAGTDEPTSLLEAFGDVAAVINCAGPFLDTAVPVALAATRTGAHYLDVSAEAATTEQILRDLDSPARAAGTAVIPSVSFFGGLADLMVGACCQAVDDIEVRTAIALDSWHPTNGTRVTGERNAAPRMSISRGRPEVIDPEVAVPPWTFAGPFGRQAISEVSLSEYALLTRRTRPVELHTYLNSSSLEDLHRTETPAPQPIDEQGRSGQRFRVELVVTVSGVEGRASAWGRDIYAISAPLVCAAAQELLEPGRAPAGAFTPAQVFDGGAFLSALAPTLHFEVVSPRAINQSPGGLS